MDHGHEDIISEMEDDVTEEHSGAGSIVSITGQIDGVLAEYPSDIKTTVTETIQDRVDYTWIDKLDHESEANSLECHQHTLTTKGLQWVYVRQQLLQLGLK